MPTARGFVAAATDAQGNIYAIGGGSNFFTLSPNIMNTVEVYSPTTQTWSTSLPMPTARYDLAAVADAQGHIYAIGGQAINGILNTVERYNPPVTIYTFIKN